MHKVIMTAAVMFLMYAWFQSGFELGQRQGKVDIWASCLNDGHFRIKDLKFKCELAVDAVGG